MPHTSHFQVWRKPVLLLHAVAAAVGPGDPGGGHGSHFLRGGPRLSAVGRSLGRGQARTLHANVVEVVVVHPLDI